MHHTLYKIGICTCTPSSYMLNPHYFTKGMKVTKKQVREAEFRIMVRLLFRIDEAFNKVKDRLRFPGYTMN